METVTTIGLGIARSGHEAMSLFWSLSGARRTSLIKAVECAPRTGQVEVGELTG
jgi:hypothetical protein